jgi:Flp pilus assembly protein CpaB
MALAFVVAALATYAAVRGSDPYHVVAMAAGDLHPGERLNLDSLSFAELRAADEVADTLLTQERLADREDWVVSQAVSAGALVALDALRAPAGPEQRLRAMSLPVPAERAVAGSIEKGDRVDIIEVHDDTAAYVAAGVEVLAAADPDMGSLAAGGVHTLTVAVDERTALVLARATDAGAVQVVRSTGSSSATVGDSLSPRGRGVGLESGEEATGQRQGVETGGS